MKKIVIVMLAVVLVLSGCGPAPVTNGPQAVPVQPLSGTAIVPTGAPMPPDEAKELLASWDLQEGEQVHVLQIGSDQEIMEAGIEGACNPQNARLFWEHIAVNHLREFPEEAVIMILDGLASGTLAPDKVVGDSNRAVIKITTMGQKWLLIIGRAVKPTLYVVTDARYIASMLKGAAVSAKPLAGIAICLKVAWEGWKNAGRPHDPDTPVRDVTPVPVRLPVPDPAKLPTIAPISTTPLTLQGQQVYLLGDVRLSSEEVTLLILLGVIVVVGVIMISGGSGGYILVLAVL